MFERMSAKEFISDLRKRGITCQIDEDTITTVKNEHVVMFYLGPDEYPTYDMVNYIADIFYVKEKNNTPNTSHRLFDVERLIK